MTQINCCQNLWEVLSRLFQMRDQAERQSQEAMKNGDLAEFGSLVEAMTSDIAELQKRWEESFTYTKTGIRLFKRQYEAALALHSAITDVDFSILRKGDVNASWDSKLVLWVSEDRVEKLEIVNDYQKNDIQLNDVLTDLIAEFASVKSLNLERVFVLDFSFLTKLLNLEELKYTHEESNDLAELNAVFAGLPKLKKLQLLLDGRKVWDLAKLARLKLESLEIQDGPGLDISSLAGMKSLKRLCLDGALDISHLPKLTSLEELELSHWEYEGNFDLAPVLDLPNLKKFIIGEQFLHHIANGKEIIEYLKKRRIAVEIKQDYI